jgi:hypothetical protein
MRWNDHAAGPGGLLENGDPGLRSKLRVAARGGRDSRLHNLKRTVHQVATEQGASLWPIDP